MNRRAWLLISVSFMIVVNSSIGSYANQGSGSSSAYGGPEIRSAPYTGPVIKAPEGKYYTEFDKDVAGIGRTVIDVLTKPMIKGLKVASDPTFPVCLTGLGIGGPLASTCTPPTVAAGIGTIVVSCGPAFSKALEPGPSLSLGEAFEKAYLDLSAKSYSEQDSTNANTLNRDLGGINFTSIKLNCISVSTDQEGGVNFDIILKAQKANGESLGIDPINSTMIGATAFITGLAVPDYKFWVRLSPGEQDRIIDEQFAQSEVGRIMLEADLQMKKDIHYYDNPCANITGKDQWDLLEKKREYLAQRCMDKFPGEIDDINNVWFYPVTRFNIVPDKVYAYTNGTQIYIINATLAIESEPETDESFFKVKNQDVRYISKGCLDELNNSAKEYGQYAEELEYRMILPYVVEDVNYGEKYEDLREVYVALALAQWYKSRINPGRDIFRESLDSSGPIVIESLTPWSPKEIWDRYFYSYKNGEYRCWENTTTGSRFHQAGGVSFYDIRNHIVEIEGTSPEVQDRVNRAIINGYVDEDADMLFGIRLYVATKEDALATDPNVGSSQEPAKKNWGIEGDSSKNRIDYGVRHPNETASGQNNMASPASSASGNTSKVTCPEGWMGPDEKGECWKLQIIS